MAYNEHWSSVGLALRFTGTNGSTAITCDKGRAITRHGSDITISTDWYDVGPSSAYYSAEHYVYGEAGSSIEVAHHADYADWGTGAGTVAFSFRTPSVIDYNSDATLFMLLSGETGAGNIETFLYNGKFGFTAGPNWDDNYYEGASALTPDTLYRVMIARNGSSQWKVMLNGAVIHTHTQYEPYAIGGATHQAWLIGTPRFELGVLQRVVSGPQMLFIDEVFIAKGVALEFGAYTPAPMFEDYAGGGDPPGDVTCDILGAIEFGGELLGGQPFISEISGAIELGGELSATQPPFAVISGALKLGGELLAGQPVFAAIGGQIKLGGELSAAVGPVATISGALALGGLLFGGRGVSASMGGAITLSGAMTSKHGRGATIAGAIEFGGALEAEFRQAHVADINGMLQLSGLLRGDFLLHPPGDVVDSIAVIRREERISVRG